MLDSETKRKIDNARDILVGKVPDPKSQVEQITIALIYKFMDDMDKDSIELGGKTKFFTGDFEKYAWSKVFDPRLGGHEQLSLYSEAIIRMNINENIPQLFRDIFKNAFLPYRDPETLKSFLKEINGFHYDHSERLGDAFEYLLSVLGSQGEAGQFRTPRHIIDFMVEVVDPKKNETILDPACGTAGFLISSYKHILKQNTKQRNGDQLTTNEKKRLLTNFVGYDISPDMVRLSLVNLYLHGFPQPQIHEYDTLTSEERWNENYDVILANPPFMSPKGGIRPHKRFAIQAKRSEVLFVDYIAEHLTIHGRAGVIVPEGIIFQSQTAYKNLRKMLVEANFLYAVVSLPPGVFQPYSGVNTSILLMDRSLAKKTEHILFVKIQNDGFDLGAQRKPIDKNDLPEALDIVKKHKANLLEGKIYELDEDEKELAHVVEKKSIAESGDWNLSGERYKEIIVKTHKNWQIVELKDVVEFNPPKSELNGMNKELEVSFIPMATMKEKEMFFEVKEKKRIKEVIKGYTYFKNGDVLLAKITPCFENGKAGIATNLVNEIGFGSTEFIVMRTSEKILPKWIYYFITEDKFLKMGKNSMTGSAGQQRVPIYFVKNYKIPLPPLSVQKEIVAEIEGYQKIIDGAKQVVENWKPRIEVDESWEVAELGDLAKVTSSKRIFQNEYVSNGIPFYRTKEIVELSQEKPISLELFISEEKYDAIKEKFDVPKKGDILVSAVGTIGISWVIPDDRKFYFKDGNLLWVKDIKNIIPEFLKLILDHIFSIHLDEYIFGAAYNALTIIKLKQIKIIVPPIEIQEGIISKIEAEQEIINANIKLIEIYENKIKSKIASIWE